MAVTEEGIYVNKGHCFKWLSQIVTELSGLWKSADCNSVN